MIKTVGRIPNNLEASILDGKTWEVDVPLFSDYGSFLHGIKNHAEARPDSYSRSARRSINQCARDHLKTILAEEYPELDKFPQLMAQALKMLSFSIRKPPYWDGDPKEDESNTCYQPVSITPKKTLLEKSSATEINLKKNSFKPTILT